MGSCTCNQRPEVIRRMKSLWTGIYVRDGIIRNQNKVILPAGTNSCPLCEDCHTVCGKCWVTKTFAHKWMFRNMRGKRQPCSVLINRIRKSRSPQGLLHSYLKQIEERIIKDDKNDG